ncbi:hypothetical protein [Pseudomonas sp. UMC65]|uniref:hypothetical protein n=1 Tax=Pseudomonas sp. UMC65 TaxID=1862323 RepID=UPI001602C7D6|nr:hypothetical protein [Pseudomonas sp. UMC65]
MTLRRTLHGLKTKGSLTKWRAERGQRLVRIWSGEWQCYWRANGCGYTTDVSEAGIYTFDEAVKFSGHCSHEKQIAYCFLPEPTP